MKRKIILIACLFIIMNGYSQRNKIDAGLEGGFNISSLRRTYLGEYQKGYSNLIAYSGGGFLQYNFPKIISVRTGAYYEKKGATYKEDVTIIQTTGGVIEKTGVKENFEYLLVPVLIKATFGSKINYFVNAGPYVGFLLKQTKSIDSYDGKPAEEREFTDNYSRTEYGLSAGLGLGYNLNEKIGLSFEVRDNLGNTNLISIFEESLKTNTLNFLFGAYIKIGNH